jgi:hypothetical protein
MIFRRTSLAGIALACVLSMGGTQAAWAQYDASNWSAPRGYDMAYPENGTPNMVARQGYAAGFNEGQDALDHGRKFDPQDNKSYGKAVIPKGMDKNQFKQEYREAYVKGYTNAYKGK